MKQRLLVPILFICALFFVLVRGESVQAVYPVCLVDDDSPGIPSHDGQNWDSAYPDLQAALADPGCTEIWVADGDYYPTSGSDRTAAFQLRDGVAIFGGFTGTETDREERNWVAYSTTLSGDIGVSFDNSDNSCHVVDGSGVTGNAVLDGFKIIRGNTDGTECAAFFTYDGGGGIYIENGSPTLRNLFFGENNTSGSGGGLYANGSEPLLENITFEANQASQNGGGLAGVAGSVIYINGGRFLNNTALVNGGGLFIEHSSLEINTGRIEMNHSDGHGGGLYNDSGALSIDVQLAHVRFIDNSTIGDGGGMYHAGDSAIGHTDLAEIVFESNDANRGAGMYIWFDDPNLNQVNFFGNVATLAGGGMFNDNGDPTLNRVTFLSNTATAQGGGVYNYSPSPGMSVTNAIFDNNLANQGGGLYNIHGVMSLINSTFWSNKAAISGNGGGIYNFAAVLDLANSILWQNEADNSPNQIYTDIFSPTISYSLCRILGLTRFGMTLLASMEAEI